jgi:cell division protein FtsB
MAQLVSTKKLFDKILNPRWLLLLLLPATWFFLFDDGLITQYNLKRETKASADSAAVLQKHIEFVRLQNELLRQGDPMTLEEEARRAGMVREGDDVYHLILESDSLLREH